MNNYINWDKKTISNFSSENITNLYGQGYVFGRIEKGNINQTRSLRIDLDEFELNSENRRVLRKVEGLSLTPIELPIIEDYDWRIHKLAKDFYDDKFGKGTFTAAKIRTLITDQDSSNFNLLLKYSYEESDFGYCISYHNEEMMHYTYPFYDHINYGNNFGMGMMLNAILWAQEQGKKYIYLGSAKDEKDKYKLQFNKLQWFDGNLWQNSTAELKKLLSPSS